MRMMTPLRSFWLPWVCLKKELSAKHKRKDTISGHLIKDGAFHSICPVSFKGLPSRRQGNTLQRHASLNGVGLDVWTGAPHPETTPRYEGIHMEFTKDAVDLPECIRMYT